MLGLFQKSFPTRPLKATRKVFSGTRTHFIGTAFMFAFAVAFLIWQGPGIVRDVIINQDPVTLEDYSVSNGSCKTWRGILTSCEADAAYDIKGGSYRHHISLAFLDFSSGDHDVDVVVSRRDVSMATLSLGLEQLWNRILVTGGFAVMFLAVGLWTLLKALGISRDNRIAFNGGMVVPVALDVSKVDKVIGGQIFHYKEAGPEKDKPEYTARLTQDEQAVYLGQNAEGVSQILGARMQGLKAPIVMDDTLTRLDFSETERRRIIDAASQG